jgi:predicted RNA-binding Zn-ribbon protein involved in translation (DUF1610 family)
MGLTCQLIGHQFGEASTERMREERGGEMVTTEREVRVCARCGDRLVISQNTEVVAIRGAEPGAADAAPERTRAGGDPHLDDILDPRIQSTREQTSESGTGAFDPGSADPAEEDAEILDPPGGAPPDAPEASADASSEAAADTQPEPVTPPADPPRQRIKRTARGPSAPASPSGSVDTVDASDEPVDVAELPDEAVEFYCPACGYAVAATLTSMRSGDICPACREGYIAERARRQ